MDRNSIREILELKNGENPSNELVNKTIDELKMKKAARVNYHAWCWHINEHETDNLWRSYAAVGSGIAIKSSIGKLKQFLNTLCKDYYVGSIYYNDFPIGILDGEFVHCLTKRRAFKSDQELRVIINEKVDIWKRGVSVPILECEHLLLLIDEIIVSPRANGYVVQVLRDIAQKYGYKFKVKRSTLLDPPDSKKWIWEKLAQKMPEAKNSGVEG